MSLRLVDRILAGSRVHRKSEKRNPKEIIRESKKVKVKERGLE